MKSDSKTKRIVSSTTSEPVTVTIPTTTSETLTEQTTTNEKKMKQDFYTHIELCQGLYKTDFCLNGGVCFTHKYLEAQIYVCDCPVPFTGSRCEEKSLEGSYGGGKTLRIRRAALRRIPRMFNVCVLSQMLELLYKSMLDPAYTVIGVLLPVDVSRIFHEVSFIIFSSCD